jgi:hypothetical protein
MRTHTLLSDANWYIGEEHQTVGPRHDPYGRDWFVVEDKRRKRTTKFMSCGLAGYAIHRQHGTRTLKAKEYGEDRKAADAAFAKLTGYSKSQWERIAARALAVCPKGRRHVPEHMSGYPGESFCICRKCDKTLSSSMNYSAIE